MIENPEKTLQTQGPAAADAHFPIADSKKSEELDECPLQRIF
jgi:hypothetical protein